MSRADWLSAIVVIVIWGLNFVVMKWGLATLSPLLLCALRFAAASLPLLLFVKPPANLSWGILAGYGLVQGVGQFGLLFTGMKLGMPAGMASVVLQTQAFITMLLAAAFLHEKPQRWQWIGLLIAISGLVLIGAGPASRLGTLGVLTGRLRTTVLPSPPNCACALVAIMAEPDRISSMGRMALIGFMGNPLLSGQFV